jgi:hypothetical protein
MFIRMQCVVDHPDPRKQRDSILVNTDSILFVYDRPADYPLSCIVFAPGVTVDVPYSTVEIAEMIRRPDDE